MPGRKFNSGNYRFGFNGKENDRDEWGSQLIQDYGFRLYNPAIAKFLSVDPLAPEYPELTPYQFAGNTPIWATDLDGLEPRFTNLGDAQTVSDDLNAYLKDFYSSPLNGPTKEAPQIKLVAETVIETSSTYHPMVLTPIYQEAHYSFETKRVKTGRYYMRADLTSPWKSRSTETTPSRRTPGKNVLTTRAFYVNALFETLESGRIVDVTLEAGSTVTEHNHLLGRIKGYTKNRGNIALWDGLKKKEDLVKYKDSNGDLFDPSWANTWTFAGTFMHEALNHTHPEVSKQSAHPMQSTMHHEHSATDHPNGNFIPSYSDSEKKKIKEQLNKTK